MRTDQAPLIRLEDYRPPDYLIETVDLDIQLDPARTRVRALLAIVPNPAGRPGAPLVLDGDELSLSGLFIDGQKADETAYHATAQGLTLQNPPAGRFTLTLFTELNPAANTKLMGLYFANGVYCTQCEADGFRRITYFLDRPDVMSTYTVRIEAEKSEAPILLGNGNCVASGDLPGTTRHFALWHDPHPKPCYLFAIVGGDLDAVRQDYVTADGLPVELAVWVEKGKAGRATWALDSLVRCMRWDEKVFGRNYDLDVFNVVAVSHFNMGAMENKGLNIFNDKYVLADPETATDADYASIEAIIAHEYFHNWTGNRITCRDWFQLCLKEGLTVFRDQEFSADERSRAVKRIADVRTLRAAQFSEDSGPLAHPVRPRAYREINNFYTPTVYEKGAELIRMLRLIIGAEAFRRGMDLYFARCDGTAATIEDFLACFAETSGRDLGHFARWYEQAGTPLVTVSARHDPATGTLTIDLAQQTAPTPGQPEKEPMLIPVMMGLVSAGATPGSAEPDRLILLEGQSRRVTYTGLASRPVPSLFRGFSAPVRIEQDLSDADLITLFVHDTDAFNRWQSLQSVVLRALIRGTQEARNGLPPGASSVVVEALRTFLSRQAMEEPAFAAQVLQLPGEGDIAREIGRDVDPDAIHAARRAMRAGLGKSLQPALAALLPQLASGKPYQPDAASAGRRALLVEALGLLVAAGNADAIETARRFVTDGDNLTLRIGGLAALAQTPGQARESAIADFGDRYAGEPLVLDKWFALQAAIPEPDTLSRVEALLSHKAFELTNPNRARALIGGFAANPTQFHRADGSGYGFVARMILALDKQNPQVAARIAGAFKTWRNLEGRRQARAGEALESLAGASLSRDVADIVMRALDRAS